MPTVSLMYIDVAVDAARAAAADQRLMPAKP
jgi:hypothetical protein